MIVIKFLLERPVKQRVLGGLFNYLIKRVLMGVPSSQLTTNFLAKNQVFHLRCQKFFVPRYTLRRHPLSRPSMLPLQTLFLVSKNSMYLKKRWFLWAIRTFFWPDPTPAKSHSFFLWLAMFNLATIFELSTNSSSDVFCFPGTALVPFPIYSGNPLMRPPLGHKIPAAITRWSH